MIVKRFDSCLLARNKPRTNRRDISGAANYTAVGVERCIKLNDSARR